MKNLDLNAYGVLELKQQEIESINGGGIGRVLWKALEFLGAVDLAYEIYDGFAEGAVEGYKAQQNK
jgi:hypothetical protein